MQTSGPWTTHGHDIPGITVAGDDRPARARCGSPGLCAQCSRETALIAKPQMISINDGPLTGGVKIRIGETWVDITEIGNMLIEAGRSFNSAFDIKADDDA